MTFEQAILIKSIIDDLLQRMELGYYQRAYIEGCLEELIGSTKEQE